MGLQDLALECEGYVLFEQSIQSIPQNHTLKYFFPLAFQSNSSGIADNALTVNKCHVALRANNKQIPGSWVKIGHNFIYSNKQNFASSALVKTLFLI